MTSSDQQGSAPKSPTPIPIRDGLAIAGVSLVLALALAPMRLWGPDGVSFFNMARHTPAEHWNHFLLLPMARKALVAGDALGVHPLRAMVAAISLVAAVGVLVAHRTMVVLGGRRAECAVGAALVASVPSAVFFGATFEVQGMLFGVATFGWWAAARLLRAPRWWNVAVLGVATGLTALVHATGHMLTLPLAAFVLAGLAQGKVFERLRPRVLVTWAVVGAVAHAGTFLGGDLFGLPVLQGIENASGFTTTMRTEPRAIWPALWHEWLVPYAPVGVLWVTAVRHSKLRLQVLALLPVLALYLWMAHKVMLTVWWTEDPPHPTEHGGYLLVWSVPFAWFTVRGSGWWKALWMVPFALGLGMSFLPSTRGPEDEWAQRAAGAVEIVPERPAAYVFKDRRVAAEAVIREPDFVAWELNAIPDSAWLQQPAAFDAFFAFVQTLRDGTVIALDRELIELMVQYGIPLPLHLKTAYVCDERTSADGAFGALVVLRKK